jgi:GNAT superfamily N-acetyltransferase
VSYLQPGFFRKGDREMLHNQKYVAVVAVDAETGNVMGSCRYCFAGFKQEDIPWTDPGPVPDSEKRFEEDNAKRLVDSKAKEPIDPAKQRANEMIASLEAMEDKDMQHWQGILMPPGTKCIIITGFSVLPQFRYKGVGGALTQWGTDQADKHGVHMWVHSSEAAVKAYANGGFEVVGILDVDLDAWAPGPAPEGEDALWGHYVIRYMKRLPKET